LRGFVRVDGDAPTSATGIDRSGGGGTFRLRLDCFRKTHIPTIVLMTKRSDAEVSRSDVWIHAKVAEFEIHHGERRRKPRPKQRSIIARLA